MSTKHGGLAAVHRLVAASSSKRLDENLQALTVSRPYHEADQAVAAPMVEVMARSQGR